MGWQVDHAEELREMAAARRELAERPGLSDARRSQARQYRAYAEYAAAKELLRARAFDKAQEAFEAVLDVSGDTIKRLTPEQADALALRVLSSGLDDTTTLHRSMLRAGLDRSSSSGGRDNKSADGASEPQLLCMGVWI